ncbi:amino acid adenylation domain-containing protein [Nocardia gipuzkoensis]
MVSAGRDELIKALLHDEGLSDVGRDQIVPRSASNEFLPLSFAQERLWLVDQLGGGSAAYNIPHAVRFRGVLDVRALEWALGEVVRRHEVLRTCYPVVGGRVVQRVLPVGGFRLGLVDLSGVGDSEGGLWERAAAEAVEPFDLAVGPVFRAELVRLGGLDHVLLLTVHHIASDGWSSGVLVGEVAAGYRVACGVGGGLPVLPVQYGDFAVWQRGWLRGEVLERQLEYWRGVLDGASVLELPVDRGRPEVLSGVGATRRFVVPGRVRESLMGLAVGEGVTLFMVLVAAFDVVLARVTGATDIVIATAVSGRPHRELESLIGFFVNTLVLRTDVSGDPSFRELVGRVREVTLGAYAHQDLPFEQLVQEMRPARDLSQPLPLFNVDCMLQNAPYPDVSIEGLDVEILDRHTWTAKSDLGLMFWETGTAADPELIGWYEYSAELFDEATVERFIEQLLRVLTFVGEDPDRRLSQLPMLSDADLFTQLAVWNHAPAQSAPSETALTVFDDTVRRRGTAPAVVVDDFALTYDELDRRANALAWRLSERGIGPEHRVGVVAGRSIDMVLGIVGVLKAGAAFVPLSPDDPAARTAQVIEDAMLSAVVCRPDISLDLPADGVPVVQISDLLGTAVCPPPVELSADNLAYVMYTSGSTGRPKGAMLEHRGLVNLIRWLARTIYHNAGGAARQGCFNAEFTSDAFVEDLCLLFLGDTMHIPDRRLRQDPIAFVEFLHDRGCELFQCSPTQMSQLLDAGLFGPRSALRTIIVAGEPISPDLWDQLSGYPRIAAWNVYGPTECSVDATYARIEAGVPPNIGRPIDNTVVRILDRFGKLAPPGAKGEICIGGTAVGRGYLDNRIRTASAFVPDPYGGTPGARLYRTGDIGSYRPDGSIAFHGRADSQIKIRGFRVEVSEVESVLRELPETAEVHCAVAGVEGDDPRLFAYVVPARDAQHLSDSADQLVQLWRGIFDIEQAAVPSDLTLDTAGWNDTASFQPIPAEEMREYRDITVGRIRYCEPRRLLEIGCGTGLVLFGLYDELERYTGVEFSPVTVAKLREAVARHPLPLTVDIIEAEATNLSAVENESYDTAVLNSTVQYFPNVDYLLEVLRATVLRLDGDGRIFLGDLRSPELVMLTRIWIEYSRADPAMPLRELGRRVRNTIEREWELLVPPQLLADMSAQVDGVAWAESSVHHGRGENEMVRFRYDAVLHRIPPATVVAPAWRPWSEEIDLDALRDTVAAHGDEDAVGWHGVANARLWRERALFDALAGDVDRTVGDVLAVSPPGSGLDPADLFDLGAELGREVRVSWTRGRFDGSVDVAFLPRGLSGYRIQVEAPKSASGSAADETDAAGMIPPSPHEVHWRHQLAMRVREFAAERLPAYMVPSSVVVLERLPINAAGKVDHRRLAEFDDDRPTAAVRAAPLATATEHRLARIWQDLLGIDAIAATDNFFVLGGHSLLANTMVNQVNETFSVLLSIRDAFEQPVLRELAAMVDRSARSAYLTIPLLPALRDEFLPLSFAQERLWLVDQLGGGSAAYNIPHAVRFRGVLDVRALEWALGEVVRRHEVLRTCYPVVGGRVVQRVLPVGGFRLGLVDLSGVGDSEGGLWERAAAEAVEPFDLAVGPVFRAELVRLGGLDHVLLLTVHHIASDGWSSGVLVGEVAAGYRVACGVGGGLPVLPVQYGDFAVWQRGWLRGEVLERQLEYWRGVLDGASVLELPVDRGRPEVLSGVGATRRFVVPGRVRESLMGLAVGEGVTLFMVLVAAFDVVLARVTGATDIVIATAVSGRPHRELESLIGFFVNTLVLRTDVSGDPSFRELVGRVREVTLGAYAHQDLPFEQLVQEMRADTETDRRDHRRPLVEVLFQLDESPSPSLSLPGLAIEPLAIDKQAAKFPLTVMMWDRPDEGLIGGIEYLAELFDDDSITALVAALNSVLAWAVENPETPLSQWPSMSEAVGADPSQPESVTL